MRNKALFAAAVTLAACSPSSPDAAQSNAGGKAAIAADAGQAQRDLKAANAAYDEALIAGDAAALGRFFTDDFTLIDDDANLRGKQEQIRTMTQVIDLLEARSDDVQITPLGDNAALLTGRFNGRYRVGGTENTFTERYTSVWVREGGEWKVRHEHASLVPKPEAASTAQ